MREISGEARNEPRTAHIRVRTVRVSPHESALPVTRVKPRDCAGEVVVLTLRTALSRIGTQRAEAGRGEPEGVHRLRAAIRRLRSELRALKDFVEPHWQEQLEVELKWLAGLLGDLRDLDILLGRFREASLKFEAPEDEQPALSPVLKGLERRRRRAAKAVSAALEMEEIPRIDRVARASGGASPAREIRGRGVPRRLAGRGEGGLAPTSKSGSGPENR